MAGVAHAARASGGIGLIAGYGETVIDAEREAGEYDVFLGQVDQRRVDGDPMAFNRGFGGEVRHGFKRVDEFGTAVGVAGIVDGVDTGEYVAAMQCLRPGQRQRQHDGVARGNVGDRDAAVFACRRDGDGCIGQRGPAKRGQVDGEDFVICGTQRIGDFSCRVKFGGMPLAVIDTERVAVKLPVSGNRQRGGGIESAGQQHDSFVSGWVSHGIMDGQRPGPSSQSSLCS